MSEGLAQFVLARITEDEQAARAAEPGPWTWDGSRFEPSIITGTVFVGIVGSGDLDIDVPDAAHIARWDPARVLAECAAKRAIVAFADEVDDLERGLIDERATGPVEPTAGTDLLRLLAQPYAGHEGFREEWKVQ